MKTQISILRLIFAVSSLSAAQQYTVTDLGTLGGTSYSTAVNDLGQVAGYSEVGTVPRFTHAFLWSSAGGLQDLGGLHPDDDSFAFGINNVGEVVGFSAHRGVSEEGFLWTGAKGMMALPNLGGQARAYAINNNGQVVGYSGLSDGQQHAFLWSHTGGMRDLGTLGGLTSIAFAVNDQGQVVGLSYLADNVTYHAFLWSETTGMEDLGTLAGENDGAYGINQLNHVVGATAPPDNSPILGFLWDFAHGIRSLVPSQIILPHGINASDVVVGTWFGGPQGTGFVWSNSAGFQNLNSLIPPGHGFILSATAINVAGQIVATPYGGHHALLLTPTKQSISQRKWSTQ